MSVFICNMSYTVNSEHLRFAQIKNFPKAACQKLIDMPCLSNLVKIEYCKSVNNSYSFYLSILIFNISISCLIHIHTITQEIFILIFTKVMRCN